VVSFQDTGVPFPLQLPLTAGATRLQTEGTIADALQLSGVDMRLQIAGPTLANIYPLLLLPLPASPPYALHGRLRRDGGHFAIDELGGRQPPIPSDRPLNARIPDRSGDCCGVSCRRRARHLLDRRKTEGLAMDTTLTKPGRSKEERLMLHLARALARGPDFALEACARRLQVEANESPSALQGPYQQPRIVRPGDPEEYRDSALVGWWPMRRETD